MILPQLIKEKEVICSSQLFSLSWQVSTRGTDCLISSQELLARSTHPHLENRLWSISLKDGARFSLVASSGILPGCSMAILSSCLPLWHLEYSPLTSFMHVFGAQILNFTNISYPGK